jgi:hypothetical protein
LPLQQLAKEPAGRSGISAFLNEDVDHVSILVDSPPEIVPLALDVHEELVQVPHVSLTSLSTPKVPSVIESELLTPLPNGLVGDDDSAFCHEVLDVSEAQTESMIQPDGVTDDLRWESVSVVAVRFAVHHRSLGEPAQVDNTLLGHSSVSRPQNRL